MKKNIKKFIPAFVIISMLGASTAFATRTQEVVSTSDITEENATAEISVDDTEDIEETSLKVNLIEENERLLFPVRNVFEFLEFEINYEPVEKIITLSKGAQYITFSTTQDGYTFAKTAPQKLGQAPIVKEGRTYAPVELLTEIMNLEGVSINGLELCIKVESKTEEVTESTESVSKLSQIIIEDINEDRNRITVNDPEKGIIILNVDGLEIDYTTEDQVLMVGQAVEVEYGDIMTASEPAMNIPTAVKVVERYYTVEVISVEKLDEEGSAKILVKEDRIGEVALIISKDTNLMNISLDEIKEGQSLKVAISSAMTRSIPPQTFAKEISGTVVEVEMADTAE